MNLAPFVQLIHYAAGHVRWNRESDAYVATGGRQDLAVYANQLSLSVDQGAAGIALVDGGIRMQEIFEAPVAETGSAPFCADDPGCHRLTDLERVPNREADIAYPDFVG